MARIYALANQKGGVGKTTTAVNLAAYLSVRDRRVLVIDVDPQANATSSLGIDKHGLTSSVYHVLVRDTPLSDIVVLTERLRIDCAPASPSLAGAEVEMVAMIGREYRLQQALSEIANHYDFIFVDCPPSLGLLTVNALTAADGVIVPVQCEYLPLEGLTMLMRTIDLVRQRLNPKLAITGMVMTMHDSRTNLSQEVVEEVREHFGAKVFDTVIPRSVRLSEAPSYGETILTYAPQSPGGLAYDALATEVMARTASLGAPARS